MPQPTTSFDTDLPIPGRGELFRIREDGKYILWFDSHTISNFTECEQKFTYNTLDRLRRKGPDRPCITIGQWWSRVSELFYTKMAAGPVTIGEIALIAAACWVENNMDAMRLTNPEKYEKFAMPTDASVFASLLGLTGFDHLMLQTYKKRADKLRDAATALARSEVAPEDQDKVADQVLRLTGEADKLEQLTIFPMGPILMACQYYATYYEHDVRNWKVIGAEKPFGGASEVLIGEDDRVVVYYEGKPDLVLYEVPTGQLMPFDQKTKDYISSDNSVIWKPHSQTAGYIYSVQAIAKNLGYDQTVDRCVISVCGRLLPAKPRTKGASPKPRFMRVYPQYSVQEIEEWRSTIMKKANRLRVVLENPKETTRVDGFLCHVFAGCDYRRLCAVAPGARKNVAATDYVQVRSWSPYNDEEE
jgi:hypothetical protein